MESRVEQHVRCDDAPPAQGGLSASRKQGGLYRQFKLDEPWDSPHNKKLLDKMPEVYGLPASRSDEIPPHHTVFQVFVGKGAAFEGSKGLRLPQDFPDGTADTLLVVLAAKPVPWTKCEDLAYDPNGPLPGLRKLFRHGSPVLMADTSVRWLKADASEASIRAAITRNGGDKLGPDWQE